MLNKTKLDALIGLEVELFFMMLSRSYLGQSSLGRLHSPTGAVSSLGNTLGSGFFTRGSGAFLAGVFFVIVFFSLLLAIVGGGRSITSVFGDGGVSLGIIY